MYMFGARALPLRTRRDTEGTVSLDVFDRGTPFVSVLSVVEPPLESEHALYAAD
jgi:hypothetical protein